MKPIDPTQQLDDLSDNNEKGGTRKIKDFEPREICLHPSHNPPMFRVYTPGVWEHTCPGCGHVTRFAVPLIFL